MDKVLPWSQRALSCMGAPGLPSFMLRWFKGLDCSQASGRLWFDGHACCLAPRAVREMKADGLPREETKIRSRPTAHG
ncbi:hypothetical protein WM40_02880 [Robbsia andropogonis]|uniref:Uncharacterized protein n=1 Tax=Robbsia andropogonis TaxID=28092 RepID=A0A0F5K481_9BURK|nr:hypothetical protein WM40_02880 [Robbsia andropogonis]